MGALHQEISFEDEICTTLSNGDWLYGPGDAALYDRARALFPLDLIAWVQATQPKAWEALEKSHGAAAEAMAALRLRQQVRAMITAIRTEAIFP